MKKKVALGLSGGVDSAVTAHLLTLQGYEVHCIYLNCFDKDIPGCRTEQDRKDALSVALHLNLPFQVLDFRKEYQASVIDYFRREYEAGRTPNPDVVCNRDIKFGLFYDWVIAQQHFDFMATGHYAKLVYRDPNDPNEHPNSPNEDYSEHWDGFGYSDRIQLVRPKDLHKDQTYFLWQVPRERFSRVLFPLGDFLKSEVRQIARETKLPVADKPDSTGICFIGEVRVEDFLKQLGVTENPGDVIDTSGNIIGKHRGVVFYTVGQRHGFEVTSKLPASPAGGKTPNSKLADRPPFYVIEKDVTNNRLVVGFGAECYRSQFQVSDLNWLIPNIEYRILNKETNHSEFSIQNSVFEHIFVRIRHGGELIPCSVISSPSSVFSSKSIGRRSAGFKPINRKLKNQHPKTDNRKPITVILSLPQRGIAPGQSAVFYDGDGVLLGGGVIC